MNQQTFGHSDLRFEAEVFDPAQHAESAKKFISDGADAMCHGMDVLSSSESLDSWGWLFACDEDRRILGSLGFSPSVGSAKYPDLVLSTLFLEPSLLSRGDSRRPEIIRTLVAAAVSLAAEHNISGLPFSVRKDLPALQQRYAQLFGEEALQNPSPSVDSVFLPEKGFVKSYSLYNYLADARKAFERVLGQNFFSPDVSLILKPSPLAFHDEPERISTLVRFLLDSSQSRFGRNTTSGKFYELQKRRPECVYLQLPEGGFYAFEEDGKVIFPPGQENSEEKLRGLLEDFNPLLLEQEVAQRLQDFFPGDANFITGRSSHDLVILRKTSREISLSIPGFSPAAVFSPEGIYKDGMRFNKPEAFLAVENFVPDGPATKGAPSGFYDGLAQFVKGMSKIPASDL